VDAEWALYHLQRALWDPVAPQHLGSLDATLQYRVNGEVYRFSSTATLRQFMKAPTRWCGMLRDPITGSRFMPSPRSPEAYWIGGPYFFESDSTKSLFIDDPHKYEIIRRM
jgi:YHS domain-containing protein